jgi:molecular chaperone GrpE (heat shock protein)
LKKTQKQVDEPREHYNKLQNETKESIKKGICEIKKITQNIKEFNKDMENLRKKNQTEILETKKFLKSNKKYS